MALRWIEGFETMGGVGANIAALLVQKYNPATGALWTPAEIAAMHIGIEHV